MTDVKINQIITEIGWRNRWPSSIVRQILAEIAFQKVMKVYVNQIVVEVAYSPKTENIFVRGCNYGSDSEASGSIKVEGNTWLSEATSGNILTNRSGPL